MDRSQRVTLDAAEPEGSHWVKRARELLGPSLARAWPPDQSMSWQEEVVQSKAYSIIQNVCSRE